MKVKVGGWVPAICACWLLACAGPDPSPAGRAEQPILDGEADVEDRNVFLLVTRREGGVGLCTASLIAPNLLLTARHCVSTVSDSRVVCGTTTASAPLAATELFASNAPTQAEITGAYRVAAIDVPESNQICGNDVALLTLSSVVAESVAVPLVPRIDRAVTAGEAYRAVGYGLDRPTNEGQAGVRRQLSGLLVECSPNTCGSGTRANEFVGDSAICSGDSGGPALDAAGKLVGVVSRSGNDCAHPVYASAAAWKDWLTAVARRAAERGGYEAPFWVESGVSDRPAGGQGERCTGAPECAEGFACWSPTQSTTDAYCAADCSEGRPCPAGTHCDAASQVCIADPASDPGSSCAVETAGAPGSRFGLFLALCALLVRTKRKSASRAKRFSCH